MSSETVSIGIRPASPPPAISSSRPLHSLKGVLKAALGAKAYRLVRSIQWAAFTDYRDQRFSWSEKAWAWRRGFLAETAAFYNLRETTWRDYLSDYVRANTAASLNGVPQFFDQKLVLRSLLLRHGFAQAETLALIRAADAQLDPLGSGSRLVSLAELEEVMRCDGGPFIVKPQDSGLGYGVSKVEARDGVLVKQRGLSTTPYTVRPARTSALVERAITQHEFWHQLFPASANTIRLLTLWTPGDAAPFIARAAQRIGASDTAPTDNFHGGGIAVPIDLASGVLAQGCRREPSGRAHRVTHHPETRARIEGATLPFWPAIRETVIAAASVLGVARYVGWDVLVDAQGTPVIIEGNANPGVTSLQIDGGLLTDPAVRRFYQALGVI